MNNIIISVIIPTYNKPNFLLDTISSLLLQDFKSYEIIVVDNACSKETKKIVLSFTNQSLVKYVCEPNIGLHNARHTGAKIAKGEILLYIDDDIIADRNLLKEIVSCYKDPLVGCVGGRVLPKWEEEPPDWIKQFPKWYLSILDDAEGPKEVQCIYGCNFSIRKDLLFELGGFNPDAFGNKKMWWYRGDGEIGLLQKVKSTGKKIIYNPNAVVWHFIPKERLTIEYFKERSFKSGIEASFTKYRYLSINFHPLNFFLDAVRYFIYYIFHNILTLIPIKYRIAHKVFSCYYKACCFYVLKLAIDKNLQKFLKKESYLQ